MDEMNEKNEKSLNRQYLLGLITGLLISILMVVSFCIARYVATNRIINRMLATNSEVPATGTTFDDKEFDDKVSEINKYIDLWFLNDTNESTLVDGAYKGIVSALDDPYSVYYTPDEYKKVIEASNGTYKGIGVSV